MRRGNPINTHGDWRFAFFKTCEGSNRITLGLTRTDLVGRGDDGKFRPCLRSIEIAAISLNPPTCRPSLNFASRDPRGA